jgi:hypothetical protein
MVGDASCPEIGATSTWPLRVSNPSQSGPGLRSLLAVGAVAAEGDFVVGGAEPEPV